MIRERASMLRYTYIALIFAIFSVSPDHYSSAEVQKYSNVSLQPPNHNNYTVFNLT